MGGKGWSHIHKLGRGVEPHLGGGGGTGGGASFRARGLPHAALGG